MQAPTQPFIPSKPRQPKPSNDLFKVPPLFPTSDLFKVPNPFEVPEPRLRSGVLCNIFSSGLLRSERCFEENDEGTGGSDGKPKTFTQEDFDRQIGKVRAEERAKFKDYDELKALKPKFEELSAELQKIRDENETRGKSAEEKARIDAEKAAKRIESERAEAATKLAVAEKRAADAESKHRDHLVSNALGAGLETSKVLTSAREKAVRLMLAESTVELGDDGKIVSVTYGGVAHKNAAEAAAAFLKDNDFLAAARGATGTGGTGTQRQNAGGNAADVFKATAEENFAVGLNQPPKQVPGFQGV